MPAPTPPLLDHCLELLASAGRPRAKRMFGGYGLYVDELFIALIVFDRLYLKVDETTRARFEAAGSQPFVYDSQGKCVTVSYWTAPDDAMDSPAAMAPWARLALQAALRAKAAAPTPRKRRSAAPRSSAVAVPSPTPAKPRRAPAASKKG